MKPQQHLLFGLIAATLFTGFLATGSFSQTRIVTSVQYEKGNATTGLGRDLWFTMSQNYVSQGGKYYALYVTSPSNTKVFIGTTGGSTSNWPISAGQVLTFMITIGWEVTTSGVVEQKGIYVWSD